MLPLSLENENCDDVRSFFKDWNLESLKSENTIYLYLTKDGRIGYNFFFLYDFFSKKRNLFSSFSLFIQKKRSRSDMSDITCMIAVEIPSVSVKGKKHNLFFCE